MLQSMGSQTVGNDLATEQNSHADNVEKIKADRGETLRSQVLLIPLLLIRAGGLLCAEQIY